MSDIYEVIDTKMAAWLVAQPVFFVATAPLNGDGLINCSPKSNHGEFAVLGPTQVAYLDQTGSGVETIAHLRENGRIIVMFCAFEGPPQIVRLQGTGRPVFVDDPGFGDLASHFPDRVGVGVRSIIVVDVSRVSDSCGYAVPFMNFSGHRPTLDQWSARKGEQGIREYWANKNLTSIDGLPGLPL